jgi:hypothetical protein
MPAIDDSEIWSTSYPALREALPATAPRAYPAKYNPTSMPARMTTRVSGPAPEPGRFAPAARQLPRGGDRIPLDFMDSRYDATGIREMLPASPLQDVFLRGMDVDQRKGKGVNPSNVSSFETAATTAGYQEEEEDDDDEDWDADFECVNQATNAYLRPLGAAQPHTDDSALLELEDIYQTYLAAGANLQMDGGVTLMLRDIPYRLQVEPDLFHILRQTVADLDHVDYVYLPMTIEGVTTRANVQPRNKGYCFIHFSVKATADAFAARVQEYTIPASFGGKSMFASRAKFQGLSANLVNLLDIQSKKWRPKHGVAHIRASTGELVCVGLLPLRNLFKKRSMRSGWHGAKTGQLRGLHSGRAGQRP